MEVVSGVGHSEMVAVGTTGKVWEEEDIHPTPPAYGGGQYGLFHPGAQ